MSTGGESRLGVPLGFELFEIGPGHKPRNATRWHPEARKLYRQAGLAAAGSVISTHIAFLARGDALAVAMHGYAPTEKHLWVGRFAVAEDFQKQGLGRSLLAHAAASWIDLSGTVSLEPRLSSVPYYEKVGFRHDPERSREGEDTPALSAPATTILASAGAHNELPPSLSS